MTCFSPTQRKIIDESVIGRTFAILRWRSEQLHLLTHSSVVSIASACSVVLVLSYICGRDCYSYPEHCEKYRSSAARVKASERWCGDHRKEFKRWATKWKVQKRTVPQDTLCTNRSVRVVQSRGRKCWVLLPTNTCYVIVVHKIMGEKHRYSSEAKIIKFMFKSQTNVKCINATMGSSGKF